MSSQRADEAFIEYYELGHDPFQQRTPGFKFFLPQRGAVLTDLHKMARYGLQIQVVTGPLGSGKTLLRQAMQSSTDKEHSATVVLLGREAATPATLLQGLAAGLGVEGEVNEDSVLDQIDLFHENSQDVYLLIDDAEQLKDDTFTLLERLAGVASAEGQGAHPVHVVLFGAPDLLEALQDGNRPSGNYHFYQLQPYTLQETREYLTQRLEGAGQGIELLTDDQIIDIHRESAGWPGLINAVARTALIEGMREDEVEVVNAPRTTGGLPTRHLMAGAAVAMAIGVAFLMNTSAPEAPPAAPVAQQPAESQPVATPPAPAAEINSSTAQTVNLPLDTSGPQGQPVQRDPLQRLALASPPPAPVTDLPPAAAVQSHAAAAKPAATPAPAPAPVSKPAPVVAPAPAPVSKPAVAAAPVPAPAPAPASKPAAVAAAPAPAAVKPAPVAPTPAPAAATRQMVGPAPASAPMPGTKAAAAAAVPPAVASKPAPVVAPAPTPAPAAPAAAKAPAPAPAPAAAPAGSGGNGWYLSQDGGQYTLQLLAVTSEASAQKVAAESGADYRYFRKQVNGKPMYVVTYGRFADRNAATAAVGRLPARFQSGKPVPQTMSTIQQYIRQGQ